MIIFKSTKKLILDFLNLVSGIIERKNTLPILSHVLMENKSGELSLLSSDVDIQIKVKDQYEGDDFSITLNARKTIDFLRSLPDNSNIEIISSGKQVTISSERSRFTLKSLPVNYFPQIDFETEKIVTKLTLSEKELKNAIHLVHYATANQDIRYYLNGVLFLIRNNSLKLVATDGHRLAYTEIKYQTENIERKVIVPRKTILELQKQLLDEDELITIELYAAHILFRFRKTELISKLIDGDFPDFERVIPVESKIQFKLDRLLLNQALQRSSIMTTDKFKEVRLKLSEQILTIYALNSEMEEAKDELPISYNGDDLEVSFNVTYLQDVLNNLVSDFIEIGLTDSSSSALFKLPGQDDFKYIVMPMRS